MKVADRRRMIINRRKWDESVPLHIASRSYDVPAFLRGRSTLRPLEIMALGSVRGKALLHLQCHFGLDTLSWARRGARVTGVDFSLPAVRAARRLARKAGIDARFIHSNIYDLPAVLEEKFDFVYTGKGALWWLPDLDGWSDVVARVLKPGGKFFFLEDHPLAEIFLNVKGTTDLEPKFPYFGNRAVREVTDGTYATDARMKYRVSYGWMHPVSQVLSALIRRRLHLESIREYPYSYWHRYSFMRKDARGWWHLNRQEGLVPLMWSVSARGKG